MKHNYMGENIRIYRERAKLTQQQLADKVGVSWEMISRYERDESSALRNIDTLSTALNVSKTHLLEKHIPERYSNMEYKIPLFVKLPSLNSFIPNRTNYFYTCPEWILHKDRECIAIESSLVDNDCTEFKKDGVLYVSTKIKPKSNDPVILNGSKKLIVKRYTDSDSKVLGVVLAQEVRY